MNLLAYWIAPVLGSLFFLGVEYYAMEQMGTDRGGTKTQRRLAAGGVIVVLLFVMLVMQNLVGTALSSLLTLVVIPLLGNRLCHSGRKYLIYYGILAVSMFLTDALVSTALQAAVIYNLIYLNSSAMLNLLHIFSARLVEFMAARLVVWAVRKNNGLEVSKKQLAASLVLPVFSVLNLFTLLYFLQIYLTREMLLIFILNVVFLLGLNLYFAVLLDTAAEKETLQKELALYRQQTQMQAGYYAQEEKKYEESRKIIHDIRNHITTMETLYQTQAAGEAAEYAGEIHGMLNRLGQTYYTSEKILNIIINDKVRQMREFGIRSDIRIGDVDLRFLQDVDVTTLYANLFDNAIAAARQGQNGWIRLRTEQKNQFLSICMENSSPQKPPPGSRAPAPGHHGMGLKNIARVVSAYEGDAQYEWQDGVFYARLLLLRKEKTEQEGAEKNGTT